MLESIIRQIFQEENTTSTATPCPEAEILACYADKTLDEDERRAVENHIVECDMCLSQVICCATAELEVEIVKAEDGVCDIVIRCYEQTMEVIRKLSSIEILPSSVVLPVRGKGGVDLCKCLGFRAEFETVVVEVEVEFCDESLGEIRVHVFNDHGLVDDVCISLFRQDDELESQMADGGNALFEDVPSGDYKIVLKGNQIVVGELSLRLEVV